MLRPIVAVLCSIVLASAPALAAANPAAEPTLPGVAAAMQQLVDAREMAGVVVLVTDKDRVLHLSASGSADIAAGKPMTTDAMFALASTTKLFAGVAMLMLQDEGKLKLADPLAKYIPEFATLRTPSGQPANLTIEHMLTHTSGIGDAAQGAYAGAKTLADRIAAYFPAPAMRAEPGAEFRYVGSFDTVGRVVEIASGKTFDEFVRERIFQPLGMRDTTFYPDEAQQRRIANSYATNRQTKELSLRPWPAAPVRGQTPPSAGGGAFSTARDLARFCQMLLNRGQLEGKRYLSEAAFASLATIRTREGLKTGFSTGEFNDVLAWGAGAYVVRHPRPAALSSLLSPGSFGHPGARGIHAVVDPTRGLAYVLLQHANPPDNFENVQTRTLVSATLAALKTPAK